MDAQSVIKLLDFYKKTKDNESSVGSASIVGECREFKGRYDNEDVFFHSAF